MPIEASGAQPALFWIADSMGGRKGKPAKLQLLSGQWVSLRERFFSGNILGAVVQEEHLAR